MASLQWNMTNELLLLNDTASDDAGNCSQLLRIEHGIVERSQQTNQSTCYCLPGYRAKALNYDVTCLDKITCCEAISTDHTAFGLIFSLVFLINASLLLCSFALYRHRQQQMRTSCKPGKASRRLNVYAFRHKLRCHVMKVVAENGSMDEWVKRRRKLRKKGKHPKKAVRDASSIQSNEESSDDDTTDCHKQSVDDDVDVSNRRETDDQSLNNHDCDRDTLKESDGNAKNRDYELDNLTSNKSNDDKKKSYAGDNFLMKIIRKRKIRGSELLENNSNSGSQCDDGRYVTMTSSFDTTTNSTENLPPVHQHHIRRRHHHHHCRQCHKKIHHRRHRMKVHHSHEVFARPDDINNGDTNNDDTNNGDTNNGDTDNDDTKNDDIHYSNTDNTVKESEQANIT